MGFRLLFLRKNSYSGLKTIGMINYSDKNHATLQIWVTVPHNSNLLLTGYYLICDIKVLNIFVMTLWILFFEIYFLFLWHKNLLQNTTSSQHKICRFLNPRDKPTKQSQWLWTLHLKDALGACFINWNNK